MGDSLNAKDSKVKSCSKSTTSNLIPSVVGTTTHKVSPQVIAEVENEQEVTTTAFEDPLVTMMGELDVTASERSLINIQTNETGGGAMTIDNGGAEPKERESSKKVLSLIDESTTMNETADLVMFNK